LVTAPVLKGTSLKGTPQFQEDEEEFFEQEEDLQEEEASN
jgi:hypothetical protein